MLHHECNGPVPLEGEYTSAHFIKDDAKGVYIAAFIASMPLGLLGRHIQSTFK